MRLAEHILKILNSLVSFAVAAALILAGALSLYALWDTRQIHQHVTDIQTALQNYRPAASAEEEAPSVGFEELQKINSDVCAWLTLEGTAIDYPVLQGKTNLVYLNTDVFGEFALSGSIFLDSRSSRQMTDPYLMIYGHHMTEHSMFGDLDCYLDEDFFKQEGGGELLTPDCAYRLEVFSCLKAKETEQLFFDPEFASASLNAVLAEAERRSVCLNRMIFEEVRNDVEKNTPEGTKILALATCAEGERESRIVLLCRLSPAAGERGENG